MSRQVYERAGKLYVERNFALGQFYEVEANGPKGELTHLSSRQWPEKDIVGDVEMTPKFQHVGMERYE